MMAVVLGVGCFSGGFASEDHKPTRLIIDADTANEIDDFYAIVRALLAPELRVEGLCSATFDRNPPLNNIRASQQFNEEILSHLGLSQSVPAPMGAARRMPDRSTPVDSPAARHIIQRAHAGGPDDKLWVIATGQCTNLASALLIDPTIRDKVVFAFIDGDYSHGRWGPGIYNWVNDIYAVQTILESDVEYFHMPAPSVSGTLKMRKFEAEKHLGGRGGIHAYLLDRWETFRPQGTLWTMWDIALVEAILRPELATAQTTGAPIVRGVHEVEQFPDNPRRVTVWVSIDVAGMLADFWQALDQHAVATAVTDQVAGSVAPVPFWLDQNSPNPFNSDTVIRFRVPGAESVDLSLYDVQGQRVATLVRGHREAGTYTVRWDGRGEDGRELASGVYVCRLTADDQVDTGKLLLLR